MDYLILAFIGFIAALTPGPDIFYVIKQGLCNGKEASIQAVAGILTGNIIYLTLVGIGVGSIGESPYFQLIVGILGGIYLLRIAYFSFKEDIELNVDKCEVSKNIYKEALFLNLSNPKAIIFFTVIITPFLSKNIMLSLVILFIGISTAFIITSTLITTSITIQKTKSKKLIKTINKTTGILFLFFATKLFLIAYKALEKIGQ